MAGHSKWNNIKNRKGAADQARAKVFSHLSKAIKASVKEGKSGDPGANPSLRLQLDKARAANMPKEKIQRAIDAGLGKRNGKSASEILYEGFGPGGVGILVEVMTDNPQRTSSEVKYIMSRHGGNLGGPGSAQYLFTRSADGMEYTPSMPFEVSEEVVAQLSELVEQLEAHDDVDSVYVSVTLPSAESAE